MRVGVFVKGNPPESGGGFTFESDILASLVELAPAFPCEFVVFADPRWLEGTQKGRLPTNVRFCKPSGGVSWRWKSLVLEVLPFLKLLEILPGSLNRSANREGIDVMWFVTGGGFEVLDVPYVATVWDLMHRSHPWFPELSAGGAWHVREARYSTFIQRASRIVVGTDVGRDEVCLYYRIPESRVLKFPHPTPGFALAAAHASNVPGATTLLPRPYVLYPAQFWPHKNHWCLLAAIKDLRERHGIEIDVALVGSDKGNREYVVDRSREFGIQDRVHFLGFVSVDQLGALYRQALALVYPSYCGPENLPPLEAFALGCPVLASRIDGAVEQLGDAAMLFSPDAPNELADRLRQLMSEPALRDRLVDAGRSRALSWTAKQYIQGVIGVIRDLAPVCRTWRANA